MKKSRFFIVLFLSFSLSSIAAQSQAALEDPLTTVELDTPVHFLAPDGSDLRVESGSYTIEPAEEWIRLISGARHDAVLIEATKGTHELELEQPMGLSIPGETEEEADLHHITLLLPDGHSLDASGSYSGIRHRGFLKNTFNNVKKKANRAYKKARSTAKKTVSKAKSTLKKTKKHVQQSAKKGIAKAKKGAKHIRKQTQRAGKKVVTTAKKGLRTARNAALNAKRHVEKTSRKVAANMRKGIQAAYGQARGGAGQWGKLSRLASAAAIEEAREWLRKVYIDKNKCTVNGPTAIGKPGVLKSRYTFQGKIHSALRAGGASTTIAKAWDRAFKESWEEWARKVMIPGLPFYPAFTAFPGPKAPPMPNVPMPLTTMPSSGIAAMSPPKLSQKVLSKLGSKAKLPTVQNAVQSFANMLGGRFALCLKGCQMTSVMGSGPVPTFAPPAVPVGPVVNGTCRGGKIPSLVGFQ